MEAVAKSVEKCVIDVLETKEKEIDKIINCYEHIQSKHTDEDSLEKIRERRRRELEQYYSKRNEYIAKGHGILNEVYNDTEFFDICKKSNMLVIHFYRPTTIRCQKIDRYLTDLANKHFKILFVKINAEKAPFVSEHLKIWCIPTIVLVKNSKVVYSIIGLDELGGDEFTMEDLEVAIAKHLPLGDI